MPDTIRNPLEEVKTSDQLVMEDIIEHTETIGNMFGVDPLLIQAIIEVESNYCSDIHGVNGWGLMQIIPSCHKSRLKKYRLVKENLLDPYSNILVGTDYLAEILSRHDDISYALVCYNKGEGGAASYGKRTSPYSEAVMEVYNRLKGE